jgi:hypothetical protein
MSENDNAIVRIKAMPQLAQRQMARDVYRMVKRTMAKERTAAVIKARTEARKEATQ